MTDKLIQDCPSAKEAECKKNKKKILTLKNANILLVLIAVSLGVTYLTTINDLTVKGFRLQELKGQAYKETCQSKDLENKVLYLGSYAALNERAKKLNMVAVGEEIAYIANTGMAVALNE